MNRYKSHKEVEAFKIVNVAASEPKDVDHLYSLIDTTGNVVVTVGQPYMAKHKPQIGGYYVRYADGYESWSPADAFEGGYTKIE